MRIDLDDGASVALIYTTTLRGHGADYLRGFSLALADDERSVYASTSAVLWISPTDQDLTPLAWHALVSFVDAAAEQYTGTGAYGQASPDDGWLFDTADAAAWCYRYTDELREAIEARYGPTLDDARSRAHELGAERGHNDGHWVIDGTTSRQTKRECLRLDEIGDPTWFDQFGPLREPLAGENAEDWTPTALLHHVGYPDPEHVSDEQLTDLCDTFEVAYREAYIREVLRSARASLAATP